MLRLLQLHRARPLPSVLFAFSLILQASFTLEQLSAPVGTPWRITKSFTIPNGYEAVIDLGPVDFGHEALFRLIRCGTNVAPSNGLVVSSVIEVRSIDGQGNNVANPSFGAAGIDGPGSRKEQR